MKIGDRVKVNDTYSESALRGAVGTVVALGMFVEVKLDDEKYHSHTFGPVGLFTADELEKISE